jgi:UDP-2,3-diacylglucosamine pyrophosphatase LpxH
MPDDQQGQQPAPALISAPLRYRTIWISDIHLGTRGCKAALLLDFLQQTQSEYLYLVGDVVDGWQLRKRWYWPPAHNDVVHKILQRARQGAKVYYIPGNHDEAARDYLDLNFGGVLVTNSIVHTTASGKKLLVLHGDQFDAVMGYAKWLAKLGDTAYTIALGLNAVFNFVRRKLGFSYWSLSAYLKHKVKNAVSHISDFEEFIAEEGRRAQVDGVICGHIHHAEVRQVGAITYYNDGDWVESCTALVEDDAGTLTIINWPKDRERLLAAAPQLEPSANPALS